MSTLADDAAQSALEEEFGRLVAEWKSQRGNTSSITKISMLPAYQKIIGMSTRAVPLILRELERKQDHWFWALRVITGANPVPPEHAGNLEKMSGHWIAWGREQGLQQSQRYL